MRESSAAARSAAPVAEGAESPRAASAPAVAVRSSASTSSAAPSTARTSAAPASASAQARALWQTLRPRQWVKNLFVLAPVFFSQQALEPASLAPAVAAAGLFCLVSSSGYLLNDLVDLEQDRHHPAKCRRPLADGRLAPGVARAALALLLVAALTAAAALGAPLVAVLAGYWLLNAAYALWLKHQVILDVFALASGYLLRVIAGGVVVGVVISQWLLICTMLVALFLGLCKRRHEVVLLQADAEDHRQVLGDYPPQFLDMMISAITAACLVSYTLYTVSPDAARPGPWAGPAGLLLTVPFVFYGFFRYLFLVYKKEEGDDPTEGILADRPMLVNLALWALTVGVLLYR
jgi:4-hydroxybenzoate polyprenyltransferase